MKDGPIDRVVTIGLRSLVATLAFLMIAVGCWLAHPAAGLIVPGAIVFASLAWRHVLAWSREP